MQIDPKMLRVDLIGETENPRAYVQKQLKLWSEELDKDPERDYLLHCSKNAIVEAMPLTVKAKWSD